MTPTKLQELYHNLHSQDIAIKSAAIQELFHFKLYEGDLEYNADTLRLEDMENWPHPEPPESLYMLQHGCLTYLEWNGDHDENKDPRWDWDLWYRDW